MDESLCFDVVGSDAYEHPFYPNFDDEESAALFRAFTNEVWEGIGPASSLGEQSTSPTCLPGQTSEGASVVHSPPPTQHDSSSSSSSSLFSSSPSSKRVTGPVSNNMMTGPGKVTPPTPPRSVIPTPSNAPVPDSLAGFVPLPPAFSVGIAEASFAFANMAPVSAQVQQSLDLGPAPSAPAPAYTGQYHPGLVTQALIFPWGTTAPAPAPRQYATQSMPPPSYPWGAMPMAPVAQQCPPQTWSAPEPRGSSVAVASFGQRHQAQKMPASAPVMGPTVSATPSKKRTLEFVDPVTPAGFIANPSNHGRFQYLDGERIYLNGPKAKKLRNSAT